MEHLKETGHITVVVSGTLKAGMIFIIVVIYVEEIKIIMPIQGLLAMKQRLTVLCSDDDMYLITASIVKEQWCHTNGNNT